MVFPGHEVPSLSWIVAGGDSEVGQVGSGTESEDGLEEEDADVAIPIPEPMMDPVLIEFSEDETEVSCPRCKGLLLDGDVSVQWKTSLVHYHCCFAFAKWSPDEGDIRFPLARLLADSQFCTAPHLHDQINSLVHKLLEEDEMGSTGSTKVLPKKRPVPVPFDTKRFEAKQRISESNLPSTSVAASSLGSNDSQPVTEFPETFPDTYQNTDTYPNILSQQRIFWEEDSQVSGLE